MQVPVLIGVYFAGVVLCGAAVRHRRIEAALLWPLLAALFLAALAIAAFDVAAEQSERAWPVD